MNARQDLTAPRTPADLERRYNFEQRFAEVMGVATDAQDTAEKAKNTADSAAKTPEEVFNLLTENGKLQGLYRGDDGELYVNASYMKSGTINANNVRITNLTVDAAQIKSGTINSDRIDGSTLNIKSGAKIAGWEVGGSLIYKSTYDSSASKSYAATMRSGSSMAFAVYEKAGQDTGAPSVSDGWSTNFYVSYAGKLFANNAEITGTITATGGKIGGWTLTKTDSYSSLTSGTIGAEHSVHLYTAYIGSAKTVGGHSGSDWRLTIGSQFGVDKDGKIYSTGGTIGGWTINSSYLSSTGVRLSSTGVNISTGSGYTSCPWDYVYNAGWEWHNNQSDKNVKNSISNIDGYDIMFDNLKPCRYKYNDGTSDRYHTGFIAQEVVSAIESAGLTTQDFAGVVQLKEPEPNGCEWLLRRDEFVALNTWQIQKLKLRVAELEARLENLQWNIHLLSNFSDFNWTGISKGRINYGKYFSHCIGGC